jgi:hypothetical protein
MFMPERVSMSFFHLLLQPLLQSKHSLIILINIAHTLLQLDQILHHVLGVLKFTDGLSVLHALVLKTL